MQQYGKMMRNPDGMAPKDVVMLGSLPPLRAISSYCMAISLAISELCRVEFISFRKIYPSFLYPGKDLSDDETYPRIERSSLKVRRRLTWYNPLSWIIEGFFCRGDLLHAQWWSTFLGLIYLIIFLEFKLRRKPIIITVHNIQSHETIWIDRYVSGILFKLCDHFIVHSASNKQQLRKYFNIPDSKISNIPHGPLYFKVRMDIDRPTVRNELGFKPQDKVVLLFGTIRSYKGLDTALYAFKEVVKQAPDARLLIAGKLWEDWDKYEKIINDLNISDYIKKDLRYIPVEEVSRFLIASDLVILPYHDFDSQSGVGAAALAFRKPLIVADTGGLPEFVEDPFYVIPPRDPVSLSEKIICCLTDSVRLAAMAEGSARIAKELSWDSIASKTLSVYEDIINKKFRKKTQSSGYIKEITPKLTRYHLSKIGLVSPGTPLNFTFSVTNLCQSRCKTCNIWKIYKDNPSKRNEELALDEIEKIFRSLGHVYVFNVSGGEPFLRNDFAEIIRYACKYLTPAVIHIPTNAIATGLIEEKVLDILKIINETNPEIQLTIKPSLDHIGENHDDIRGVKGNFDKVITLFQRLKVHKARYKNLHVELGTIISNWNIDEVEKISSFVSDLRPDSYRNEIAEQRSEMFNRHDSITPSFEEYERAIDIFKKNAGGKNGNRVFFQRLNNAFRIVYYDQAIQIMKRKKQIIPCYAGVTNAHMSAYGDIWPCCTLGYEMSMGNIREFNYDFRALWNSPKAGEVRNYINRRDCFCPLANQSYSNILMHLPSMTKVFKNVILSS